MNKFNLINDFYCQKVIPLVYDNSLSYYEVLCKLKYAINEVIKNQNTIIDYFVQFQKYVDEKLKEYTEDVLQGWLDDGTIDNLVNVTKFNELRDELNARMDTLAFNQKYVFVNIEEFPRLEGEENDYLRLMRAYNYCKANNINQLMIPKSIDIKENIFIVNSKFFQIMGATNADLKVIIKGNGLKVISVQEQGFTLKDIIIQGDLNETGNWNASQTTGISYDYVYQDMDSNLINVGFSRCNRCIDFYGRNIHAKNTTMNLSNYGIRISKNLNDQNNPNGTDIRGVDFQDTIFHTMGQNLKNKGQIIIEIMDVTNGQEITFNNVTIEQGAKRFFDGYISGCRLTNIKVANARGSGNFINIKERPAQISLQQGIITGEFNFNLVSSPLIDDEMVERCINAITLEKCLIDITSSNTRYEAIKANTITQCTIDNNILYNAGYRSDLDGEGVYSAIKIDTQALNSTIVNNYINGSNMKYGVEVELNNGSYIADNKVFFAKVGQVYYRGSTSTDLESFNSGNTVTTRRNNTDIAPNASIGSYKLRAYNGTVLYDVGELRFVFNSGEVGSETTNIQIYIKQNGAYVRVCSFNGNGVSIDNDKFVMLQGKYLWFDSQTRLRCSTGKPSNLDNDGTIVGTQS